MRAVAGSSPFDRYQYLGDSSAMSEAARRGLALFNFEKCPQRRPERARHRSLSSADVPYMHDGSIETLSEVLDHYAAAGRTIESGPYAGNGHASSFLTNPALSDPWE